MLSTVYGCCRGQPGSNPLFGTYFGTKGQTLKSTTRRALMPCTRKLESTHESLASFPIRTVLDMCHDECRLVLKWSYICQSGMSVRQSHSPGWPPRSYSLANQRYVLFLQQTLVPRRIVSCLSWPPLPPYDQKGETGIWGQSAEHQERSSIPG